MKTNSTVQQKCSKQGTLYLNSLSLEINIYYEQSFCKNNKMQYIPQASGVDIADMDHRNVSRQCPTGSKFATIPP